MPRLPHLRALLAAAATLLSVGSAAADGPESAILTPAPAATPHLNNPAVFGVRPGSPFLFSIPATGDRPMKFGAEGLPDGLVLDPESGRITGSIATTGVYAITLTASNATGTDERPFTVFVGERISLTPPLGWNSWNCWAGSVDQDKVLRSARAMVASGLARHGWVYINIDDTWQGVRSGPERALGADPVKFPDMKGLVDAIHALGLKAGIYSTPWKTSYAGRAGGSADDPSGAWTPPPRPRKTYAGDPHSPWSMGSVSFANADARQWAAWGFDYLKYDWYPNDVPSTEAMATALRASGRDVILSLSNAAPYPQAAEFAKLANSWRTTGDIRDTWESMSGIGFSQDRWVAYGGPGHWNDPDMLVVGRVGWGPQLHPTRLTPDEQYTHISLWSLLSAPLLLGCDLEKLDAFTLSLLTNDDVLAIDQDPLGRPATTIGVPGAAAVYAKPLDDGAWAVGLFNRGDAPAEVTVRWDDLGLDGPQRVRDLWRQKDVGVFAHDYRALVAPHGVVLVRVRRARTRDAGP